MQKWFGQMKEYLKMDDEIPFREFQEYTQGFLAYLGPELDTLDSGDLVKARFMLSILQGNATDRGKRKSPETKKYKKIVDKTTLWVDAVTLRLARNGMTPTEIDQATQEVSDSMDVPDTSDEGAPHNTSSPGEAVASDSPEAEG